MNALIGLAIALVISMVGNVWLFNSRDGVIEAKAEIERDLRNSRALEKQCSDSVAILEEEAKARQKANAAALKAAREAAKGKTATGQQTLSTARSVPADECASTEKLLSDWFNQRSKP